MRPLTPPATRAHPNYQEPGAATRDMITPATWQCQAELCVDYAYSTRLAKGRGRVDMSKYKDSNGAAKNLDLISADLVAKNTDFNTPARQYVALIDMRSWSHELVIEREDLISNILKRYANARADLINTLGYYCSYCEMPLGGQIHVEHKLPKRYYPARALDWDNFLLACPSCNSSKGDWPNRVNSALQNPKPTWVPSIVNPTKKAVYPVTAAVFTDANESAIQASAMAQYIWPDETAYDSSAFLYTLYSVTYPSATAVPKKTAINLKNLGDWIAKDQVDRLPPYAGTVVKVNLAGNPYQVELHIEANTSQAATTVTRAQQTIENLKLNGGKPTDLRVPLRTAAFLQAVKAVWLLNRAYARYTNDPQTSKPDLTSYPAFTDILEATMDSILTAGFWLVWMRIFEAHLNPNVKPLVKSKMTDPNRFPGTRWA